MLFRACPVLIHLLQKDPRVCGLQPPPQQCACSTDSWSAHLWVKGHLSVPNQERKIGQKSGLQVPRGFVRVITLAFNIGGQLEEDLPRNSPLNLLWLPHF